MLVSAVNFCQFVPEKQRGRTRAGAVESGANLRVAPFALVERQRAENKSNPSTHP